MILTLVSLTCVLTVSTLAKPLVKNTTVVCPPSEDGFPVFLPHPTNCRLYYLCMYDWPIPMSCRWGLYFDPELNVCNFPYLVDCASHTTDAPKNSTSGPVKPTDAPFNPTTGPVKPTDTPVKPTTGPVRTTEAKPTRATGCIMDNTHHEVGETFRQECNTCHCGEGGHVWCTDMLCT